MRRRRRRRQVSERRQQAGPHGEACGRVCLLSRGAALGPRVQEVEISNNCPTSQFLSKIRCELNSTLETSNILRVNEIEF